MTDINNPRSRKSFQSNFNMDGLTISTILHIDPIRRTCQIRSAQGTQTIGISSSVGNASLPPNNGEWRALVNYNSNTPMVISFAHPSSFLQDKDQIDKSLDSGGDEKRIFESLFGSMDTYSSYSSESRNTNYRGRMPFDLIPGDISFFQEYWGNSLTVGMGGVNQLKVSEKNFFMQSLIDNLTRMMAGNLEIITDFGVLKFDNTDDKVKMHLKADRNFNKKVQEGLFDIDLQIGNCDDGNTVSFKYKTEKNSEPFILTIDTKGRMFTNVPSDSIDIYGENKIESVTKNKATAVQENFDIDVGETYTLTTKGGDGTIKLGGESLYADTNELVRKPHLKNKYKPLVEKLGDAVSGMMPADILPIPLIIKSPDFLKLYIELMLQKPTILDDSTTVTWGN